MSRTTSPPTGSDVTAATAAGSPPEILGRYRLNRRLGQGAFGSVWRARDEHLDRDVAVKILPRARVAGGRFEREARAAARLSHPGIVTLYEAGTDSAGAYLVSELVQGATLEDLLADGRLSDRDVAEIGVALCGALEHAHLSGVIHRDVKPSNILIPKRPTTPADRAKLTDFGVARVLGGDTLTRTGDVLGTAAYMAPEQAAGRESGAEADLFSLAVVLYEALTGVNPVRSIRSTQRPRLAVALPPLRRQRRDLPHGLAQALDRALRPRAGERGSVAELAEALNASVPALPETPGVVQAPITLSATLSGERPDPSAQPTPPATAAELPKTPLSRKPSIRVLLPGRICAALVSGGVLAYAAGHLLRHPPLSPLACAAMGAGLVLLLPRLGYLALTAAFGAELVGQRSAGLALLLTLAALPPVLLMPRRGWAWPLAMAAPALGALSLALAWPAVVAVGAGGVSATAVPSGRVPLLRGAWTRAVLAGCGWLWLVLAEPLTGAHLGLGLVAHEPARSLWVHGGDAAARGVLRPLLSWGLWLPGLIWALAAGLLPPLRGARAPLVRWGLIALWSALLTGSTAAALGAVPPGSPRSSGRRGRSLGRRGAWPCGRQAGRSP